MPGQGLLEGRKETKEEKTQEILLKDVFGEKKGSLYYQLNLDQFVNKETGKVETDKLKDYLKEKGFSEGLINNIIKYLEGDTKIKEDQTEKQIWVEWECIETIRNELLAKSEEASWLHDFLYVDGTVNEKNLDHSKPRGGRRRYLEDDLPHVLRSSPPPPQSRS